MHTNRTHGSTVHPSLHPLVSPHPTTSPDLIPSQGGGRWFTTGLASYTPLLIHRGI